MSHASPETSGPTQPFTLYAAHGRVYATNVRQKLIDLGRLSRDAEGYSYLLDGNKDSRSGFATPENALRHIGRSITFLFLDGQFTALENLRGESGPDLSEATAIDIDLEELAAGSADDTPG